MSLVSPPRQLMFPEVKSTYNAIKGCLYDCVYCYARETALNMQRRRVARYWQGFDPSFFPPDVGPNKVFSNGLVMISSMGDPMGPWVPDRHIMAVFRVVARSPKAEFLCLTKNPCRFQHLPFAPIPNAILGATIETNRTLPEGMTLAPPPGWRARALMELSREWRRFVSIEPIMDFDLDVLVPWIQAIGPEFVYIGYDNHGYGLPEPPLDKTMELVLALGQFTEVRLKNMERGKKR